MTVIDTAITSVTLTPSPDGELGIVLLFDTPEVKPFVRSGITASWLARLIDTLGTGAIAFGDHPSYRCRVRIDGGTVRAISGGGQWFDVEHGDALVRLRPPTRGEKALRFYNKKRALIGRPPIEISDEYTEDDAIADAKHYGWDG